MSDPHSAPPAANFLQFISGIAVQTLVHLGKMSNPLTKQSGVDLPNARYSIDILAVLRDKTKGNLTPQEDEYIQNVLRDLRLEYVAVAEGGAAKPDSGDAAGDEKTREERSGEA